MRKDGESKTARIMMATVPHVTSGLGLRKFQTDGFWLTRVYLSVSSNWTTAYLSYTYFRKGSTVTLPCWISADRHQTAGVDTAKNRSVAVSRKK